MRPFLTANWTNLLLLNFEADKEVLKPYVPRHTELDDYQGITYVSLVGFLFENTRVKGIAMPGHRNFEEVNLRFYVRYKEDGNWKRGVVFIKELVPKPLITFVANTLYKENYATLPMAHNFQQLPEANFEVSYKWKLNNHWNHISAVADKAAVAIPAGSESEFILEHYWGYTQLGPGITGEYEVQHPRWKVFPVKDYNYHCDTLNLYGEQFVPVLEQAPRSVMLAAGSEIAVMPGRKIKG